MKLKNKILLILLICIVLFLLISSKGYCATGDFESTPDFPIREGVSFNDVKSHFSQSQIELYDSYTYHLVTNNYIIYLSNYPFIQVYDNEQNHYFLRYDPDSYSSSNAYVYLAFDYHTLNITQYSSITTTNLSTTVFYTDHNIYDVESGELVFRRAGGATGDGLQNPYGEYQYSSNTVDNTSYFGDDFEDTSDGGWLSGFINWLLTPFRFFAQILSNIWNFLTNIVQRILAGLFDFFKLVFIPDPDDFIFDDAKSTLLNKFPFISSFSQIQTDFSNAFNNEENCPTFTITLPAFLGGVTVNAIDFRFYNQYRSFIHGFIVASCYFLYIRKIYHKIPKIIKGE